MLKDRLLRIIMWRGRRKMTIWEILIGGPMAVILVMIAIIAVIGFSLFIVGFPFLILNLYKNYKNQVKISWKEILAKTYF